MKYLVAVLILLSGCASPKILVRNCKAVGTNLYECEQVPSKEVGRVAR